MKLIKDKEKINDLFSWIWRHLYDQKQEAYEFTHFKVNALSIEAAYSNEFIRERCLLKTGALTCKCEL